MGKRERERGDRGKSENARHYLHSVVLLIANVNEAECIGCYAPRIIEFAICGALRAEGAQEASLWIKHLYAMIVSATERERMRWEKRVSKRERDSVDFRQSRQLKDRPCKCPVTA